VKGVGVAVKVTVGPRQLVFRKNKKKGQSIWTKVKVTVTAHPVFGVDSPESMVAFPGPDDLQGR
jgi:hypothetical protein